MNMHVSSQDRTIARQRDRIEILEEENRQLRKVIVPVVCFPLGWKLTGSQHKLLSALIRVPGCLTLDQCWSALETDVDHSESLLNVQIMKLRRKVAPIGIKIVNRWGIGYELDASSREIVKAALGGAS